MKRERAALLDTARPTAGDRGPDDVKFIKAYRYRLYPSRSQIATLNAHLALHCELYNAALYERREAWKARRRRVSLYEQMRSLPEVKRARPEFSALYAQSLQATLARLERAYEAFFRRVKSGQRAGFPRFRSIRRFDSLLFPQLWDSRRDGWVGPGAPLAGGSKIRLPGVGSVRIKMHRPLDGHPKTLSIKREGDAWYAVYTCEVEIRPLTPTAQRIGIDLGLNPNFLVTSSGEFVPSPAFYRKEEARLRRAKRVASRRERGSARSKRALALASRIERRIASRRRDFHHKLACRLVRQYDLIVHERLGLKGLARTWVGKSLLDAGWGSFIAILTYKAEWAGRQVVAVDPSYTSQICSVCGHREKHPLWERRFVCSICGTKHHRDVNATKNILALGLDGAVGEGWPSGAAQRSEKPAASAPGVVTSTLSLITSCEAYGPREDSRGPEGAELSRCSARDHSGGSGATL